MFRAPNACSLVEGAIAPNGWCKHFEPKAKAKIGKANAMSDFSFFLPIEKIDEGKRLVCGYASTPEKDSDGEIVTLQAVKNALPDYMAWGNVREMHKLSAGGSAAIGYGTSETYLPASDVDAGACGSALATCPNLTY